MQQIKANVYLKLKSKSIVKYLFILLFALTLSTIKAQEVIPASGGDASGSGGTVSYSVGQIVYTTNNGGANGSVAQGVQQPFEISVVTAIEEAKGITLQCSAYPNPVADFIKLTVKSEKLKGLSYQLFDINGKLIESRKIENNETRIVMSNLVPATYFLKVTEGNKEVKTFKINKN